MLASLLSLGIVAAIALACLGLGRPLARALRGDNDDLLTSVVWRLSLGLVAAGFLLTVAGFLGVLDGGAIRIATAIAAIAGCLETWRVWRRRLHRAKPAMFVVRDENELKTDSQPPRWLTRGLGLLAAVAVAATFVSALAPATAGDALCYHLDLPKRFLQSGSLKFLPYQENSTFPLLAEMWFLWAMALDGTLIGGGIAAQLVHLGIGLLFALAATLLARPILGADWSCIVGCLLLLTPGVTNQMTAPLNDVALALFTTLALCAWREAMGTTAPAAVIQVSELGADPPHNALRGFTLAGIALGAALGIKFLAMVFAAAVGAAAAWEARGRREFRRQFWTGFAVVAVVSLSVGGAWYLRSAWHRGNPVYPFFGAVLGGGGPEAFRESKTPLEIQPLDVATAPWQVTMLPDRFGGRGHQLGPMFLMLLPGLLLARRLRGLASLLGITAAYLVFWYLLRQNLRFLLPIVPLLWIAVVWVWIELGRAPRVPAALVRIACAAIVLLLAAIPLYRAREHWPISAGLASREAWLEQRVPGYRAAVFAEAHLPPTAKILSQDYRGYYFPCDVVRENVYRRRHPELAAAFAAADERLVAALVADGFSHLLIMESDSPRAAMPEMRGPARRRAGGNTSSGVTTLFEYVAADAEGHERCHRLLQLGDGRRR